MLTCREDDDEREKNFVREEKYFEMKTPHRLYKHSNRVMGERVHG